MRFGIGWWLSAAINKVKTTRMQMDYPEWKLTGIDQTVQSFYPEEIDAVVNILKSEEEGEVAWISAF